jgi:hypothetical protein
MFFTASLAEAHRLSIALLVVEAEKFRRQMGRNTDTIGNGRDMVDLQ